MSRTTPGPVPGPGGLTAHEGAVRAGAWTAEDPLAAAAVRERLAHLGTGGPPAVGYAALAYPKGYLACQPFGSRARPHRSARQLVRHVGRVKARLLDRSSDRALTLHLALGSAHIGETAATTGQHRRRPGEGHPW